jgi:hypothetical protein
MRKGDTSRGPSENKSQDWLIVVDFLNLASEGLLLGMQAEGLLALSHSLSTTCTKEMQAGGLLGAVRL